MKYRTGGSVRKSDAEKTSSGDSTPGDPPSPASATSVLHHEFVIDDIPELAPLIDELPTLRLRPSAVDLESFDQEFQPADYRWTDDSPASPGFQSRYEKVMRPHWTGSGPRRDFHLINLDQFVRQDEYGAYCDAKVRTLEHLERVFGSEIRFSGSMWYPPFAYRLWHTNETQPGWRMYMIDFDAQIPRDDTRTFMRYMDPQSRELITLPDRPRLLRFFRIRQEADHLLWHCIVNGSPRHRWSFGFVMPDDWMDRLSLSQALNCPTAPESRRS